MLIDSHCHLNILDYTHEVDNLEKVLDNCKSDKIEHLLCVSIDLEKFPEILAIANKYNNISISAGVHPNEDKIISGEYDISLDKLKNNLLKQARNQKVVAIGETGLDFYRTKDSKDEQINRLITHIEVAQELDKPLIIHTREAQTDTIDVLKNNKADICGGVMHCFTENWDMAKQALDMGFYISISGIVTFKNAKQVQEVATKTPIDRLLIETDSPYLAPVPKRGKPNFPNYVKHVAEYIAELREIDFETLARNTTTNFYNLFKINV